MAPSMAAARASPPALPPRTPHRRGPARPKRGQGPVGGIRGSVARVAATIGVGRPLRCWQSARPPRKWGRRRT